MYEIFVRKRDIDGKSYWSSVKTFEDLDSAEKWLADFTSRNGFDIDEYKIDEVKQH